MAAGHGSRIENQSEEGLAWTIHLMYNAGEKPAGKHDVPPAHIRVAGHIDWPKSKLDNSLSGA